MKRFSFLLSYRSQLIISLIFILLIIFGYGFYVHIATLNLEVIIQKPVVTQEDVANFIEITHSLSQVSFFFLAIALVVIFTLLMYMVLSLSFALKTILHGIYQIAKGNFSYQIPLKGKNEFVVISQFLNAASLQLGIARKELIDAKEVVDKEVTVRTHQYQAERDKLSVILSGITDSVIALDLQRNIVMFNTNAEFLTGFITQQVMGKNVSQVVEFFEEKLSVPINAYAPVKSDGYEGIVFVKDNVKMVSAKGKISWVRLTVSQIKEGNQVNLGNILTIRDRTREHELEEMKLDFVSMAAHELRTPLTSIKGYLSVFISENKDKIPQDSQVLLNRIAISSDQLSGLVENILSVSRIERGAYGIHIESIEWIPLVERLVNDMMLRAQEKKIRLDFKKPSGIVPNVKADKMRIQEVVQNLLSNAINYTPEGGVVTISFEVSDSMVVTHIKDTGKGIPSDSLPHLFTKFFRVAGKVSQGSKGTGLGLYISKSIVELHEGKIWAESSPGEGATFSFSLPIAS